MSIENTTGVATDTFCTLPEELRLTQTVSDIGSLQGGGAEIGAIVSQIMAMLEEIKGKSDDLEALRDQRGAIQQALEASKKKFQEQQAKLGELEVQVRALGKGAEKERAALNGIIEGMRTDLATWSREIQGLQQSLASVDVNIEDVLGKIHALGRDIDAKQMECQRKAQAVQASLAQADGDSGSCVPLGFASDDAFDREEARADERRADSKKSEARVALGNLDPLCIGLDV